MTDFFKVPFDAVIFNLVRLDIIGELDSETEIPFTELRNVLKLSDGNLASHLRVLDNHGIIRLHKSFVNKKPQTRIKLTSKGKEQFEKLKQWFYESFIEGG